MRWVLVACLLAGCAEAGFPLPGQRGPGMAYRGGYAPPPPAVIPMPTYQPPPQPAPARITTTNCQRMGTSVQCYSN